MLGTEPQLISDYVETGQVRIVFWPVLNHGNPSIYSTLAAECAGRQDPALFWAAHDALFAGQDDLWSADRDYYIGLAEGLGADREAFGTCYDDGSGLATVMELDELRRRQGIFSQPVFDINGELLAGLQDYVVFQRAIDTALESSDN